ncbi:cell division protein ZapA [Treponema ruminis]|uniref:Cell division protein ZapA n=1 Tax=Treponema ruminis TaxID=744515 RepID=A0A7W8LMB1_9SPIR|nr:cell division protein ZapA [Treponema ruminis]MBB5226203.1 cell division protein ZapA [Treponema ruminis]QSI02890.1 cell division protein ZapA [Treponema ruminis]
MGALQIDVFNSPFVIQVNEDDEYLQKLLWYYKKILERIERNGALKNPVQISALAGIMLCDELYKEKSKAQLSKGDGGDASGLLADSEESNEAERLAKMMIERIDKALES